MTAGVRRHDVKAETRQLHAADALLPDGWAKDVLLGWDEDGTLASVRSDTAAPAGVPVAAGPVLPGMPNLHSHAFQRGFAGLTEIRASEHDSFWSWRDLMYRFAARLSPDTLEAIATQLYIEMLQAGYTSVCEFQYVHHDPRGRPYAETAEMSLRLLRAARVAGIGITLLPVLYQAGGFGGQPARTEQRRFLHDTHAMLSLLQRLAPACAAPDARLGLAPHSLRAVAPDALREAVQGLHAMDATAPVHIHVAEQQQEVDDCLAWSGRRPVAWLLDHAPVDARWCLVHATHLDDDESRRVARSGAVVGLCPTTEANLGDGLFDARRYLDQAGAWGIGSDSHVGVDVAEELRLLEYGQRLQARRRNVLADAAHPDVAQRLWLEAAAGGARASGRPIGALAVGCRADFVVLDGAHVALAGLPAVAALGVHLFARHGHRTLAQCWTAGRCRIRDGAHPLQVEAGRRFVQARRELFERG